jgi:hypothetical protein
MRILAVFAVALLLSAAAARAQSPNAAPWPGSRPVVTLENGVSGTPGDERFERGLKDIVQRQNAETIAHINMEPRK